MTAIVGVKKGDTVYMCADSQSTLSDTKFNYCIGINRKLALINDEIIVADAGLISNVQIVLSHPEWFEFDKEEGLTKEFLSTHVCPKIYEEIKKCGALQSKPDEAKDIGCELLIAWKDKMFEICSSLVVMEYQDWQVLGSGSSFILYHMKDLDLDGDINRQMVDAIKECTKFCTTVSGPYLLMDTKNLEYTIVEE